MAVWSEEARDAEASGADRRGRPGSVFGVSERAGVGAVGAATIEEDQGSVGENFGLKASIHSLHV